MEYLISSAKVQNQSIDINSIFARYHNIKGTKSADNGRIKEALIEFDKAIKLDPEYSLAYFNRGTVKADLGDFIGAKADFEREKELDMLSDPESANTFRLSYYKVQSNQYD